MITLTLDNITKVVATDAQAAALVALGYTISSGSAEESPSVALGAVPSFLEDYSNTLNPAFRGEGLTLNAANTIGYIAALAQPELDEADFTALMEVIRGHEDTTTTLTSLSVVDAKPVGQAISTTTLYFLTTDNTLNYNDGSWHVLTL